MAKKETIYTSPAIDIVEIAVEMGFAGSTEDYSKEGDTPETDSYDDDFVF